MSTIGDTIDAWGLPSEAAQKLKSWLALPTSGWELGWLPDQDFWGLEDQHLQAAGIVALDTRRAILRKLQERGSAREGLKARRYRTERRTTAEEVLRLAAVKGAVMLQGPPQTGKTSLLQLLQKRAEESHEFSRIIHLNMARTDGDLHAALSLLKTSWEELFAVAPDGTQDVMLLLVDEIQMLFAHREKIHDFWRGLNILQQGQPAGQIRGLRVSLAGLGGLPEAAPSSTALGWGRDCTIRLDHNDRVGVGLQLPWPEYQELVRSFRALKWTNALASDDLNKAVYRVTAGQAGSITLILDGAEEELFGVPFTPGAFDTVVRRGIVSGRLCSGLRHFRSFAASDAIVASPRAASALDKLLSGECKAEGLVNDITYTSFISPLHRLYYMHHYLPWRVPRVEVCSWEFAPFLRHTLCRMSSSRLRCSLTRSRAGSPHDRQHQINFCTAAVSTLQRGMDIVPDAVLDTPECVDFWVDLPVAGSRWAVELLKDGYKAREHAARFAQGGAYAMLPPAERALVDFRDPLAPPLRREHADFHQIFFTAEYSSAVLIGPDGTPSEVSLQA